jgi:ABC-type maltose transport system permease subunit
MAWLRSSWSKSMALATTTVMMTLASMTMLTYQVSRTRPFRRKAVPRSLSSL